MSCRAFWYVPKSIVHHWITVLVTCVLIGGAGLPVIWLLVEPYCVVRGAIHVAPFLSSVLTGQPDKGEISDYGNYMNTQAVLITSGRVLEKVADDLAPRSLAFFSPDRPVGVVTRLKRKLGTEHIFKEPSDILKADITAGTISAEPIPHTELIGVSMEYPDEREAKVIVDSFLSQFKASYGLRAHSDRNQTLTQLEVQERELAGKIERQQKEILRLAQEHGTTALDSQQEMVMQRQTALATELTRLEIQRLGLEAKVAVLQQGGDSNVPQDVLAAARRQYVNSDPMVEELVKKIVETKLDLIVAEQNVTPGDPELLRSQERLATFEAILGQKEKELGAEFEEQMRSRAHEANTQRLAAAKAELEQIQANEDRLRTVLSEEESATRRVGIAGADYARLISDMRIDKELYDTVLRRRKSMEMQLDRRGRVSIAFRAELVSTVDGRGKLTGIVWVAGLLAGMVLAVARGPRKVSH